MSQATQDGVLGAMLLLSWPIAFVLFTLTLVILGFSLYYLRFLWIPVLNIVLYVVSFVFTWSVFLTSWIFAISGIMYLCGLKGPLPWFWAIYKGLGRALIFKVTGL